jgi:uncharacterized integral membrane protein
MAGLQKILIILLVLVLVLLALVFSLNNQMAVSLNFLLFETQPHGVAVWMIMAFVVGALVGVLMTMLSTVRTSVSRRTSVAAADSCSGCWLACGPAGKQ